MAPATAHQPKRTPAEVLLAAEVLKREAPARTAAQVARALAEARVGTVSARTLQRHFAYLGLNCRPDGSPPRALGRFECRDFGEMWTGDALHGPKVAGAKVYLFAFIDDWSRTICGWRWGLAEDTLRPSGPAWSVPASSVMRRPRCTGASSGTASSRISE